MLKNVTPSPNGLEGNERIHPSEYLGERGVKDYETRNNVLSELLNPLDVAAVLGLPGMRDDAIPRNWEGADVIRRNEEGFLAAGMDDAEPYIAIRRAMKEAVKTIPITYKEKVDVVTKQGGVVTVEQHITKYVVVDDHDVRTKAARVALQMLGRNPGQKIQIDTRNRTEVNISASIYEEVAEAISDDDAVLLYNAIQKKKSTGKGVQFPNLIEPPQPPEEE